MGIPVTDILTTTSPDDEYPITDPKYGLGGHRTVNLYTDLTSIPNPRRQEGMTVYVIETKTTYVLIDNSWIPSRNIVIEPDVSQW